jgi:hypothetical protein
MNERVRKLADRILWESLREIRLTVREVSGLSELPLKGHAADSWAAAERICLAINAAERAANSAQAVQAKAPA